jgi:flavin-dependent dehydrogenase
LIPLGQERACAEGLRIKSYVCQSRGEVLGETSTEHAHLRAGRPIRAQFDLVILGAGPAGCAAAITAATRGLTALLIERDEIQTFKPGDCLHPGAEPILKQLDVWEDVAALSTVRPKGRLQSAGENSSFEFFGSDDEGSWQAIHITRPAFDRILMARALFMGVSVKTGLRNLNLQNGGPGFGHVDVDGECFGACYVIDATGRAGFATRLLRQRRVRTSPNLVSYYGYFEGRIAHEQMFCAGPAGWHWLAQTAPALVNWTAMSFPSAHRPQPPEEVCLLAPCQPTRAVGATWEIAPDPMCETLLFVGDAAGALDPASSNGILLALMSGIAASDAIASVILQGVDARWASARYRRWMSMRYAASAQRLSSFYHQLNPSWSAAAPGRTIRSLFRQ